MWVPGFHYVFGAHCEYTGAQEARAGTTMTTLAHMETVLEEGCAVCV